MRIAQLSPLWERVPPPAYGGIELVVSLLTEELVCRGHQVTLFASGDSITKAELRSVCPRSLRTSSELVNRQFYEWVNVASCLRQAGEFDLIHNHCGEMAMVFANLIETPMLTTSHGPLIQDSAVIWDNYPGYYNTISRAAKDGFPDRNYLGVVYNAVEVDAFPFREEKEGYLLFLSRISPEKGTHHAIEVARRLGRRLIIAGKIDPVDEQYFLDEIEPNVDGRLVEFFGEADVAQKRDLFARASCLLHPVTWPEPFGLVMPEAMACGTPVIGFRRGSVPEIVLDGETGFVVSTVDEMVAAVGRLGEIDPRRCRQHVEANFQVSGMADGYVEAYGRILSGVA